MRQFLRDSGHLVRPAVVLIVGIAAFLLIRTALIPKAFGYSLAAFSDEVLRQVIPPDRMLSLCPPNGRCRAEN